MVSGDVVMYNGKEYIHVFHIGKNKRIYVRAMNLNAFQTKSMPLQYDVYNNILVFKPVGNRKLRQSKPKPKPKPK